MIAIFLLLASGLLCITLAATHLARHADERLTAREESGRKE